ncbi:MAG: hypothetical protein KKI02_10445, partial [Planctomycetes bacterium]|nr:hypothetical protein [Planctomycetota bacterium]
MPPTITDAGRLHLKWALIDGIGPLLFSRLMVQFGNLETAMGASAGQLTQIKRIGRESAERIARERETVNVESEIEAAAEHDVRIICQA